MTLAIDSDTAPPSPLVRSPTERAYLDFLRKSLADLPDPAVFAWTLEGRHVDALLAAWRAKDAENLGCLRVSDEMAPELQALGLVAVGGPYLGNFGKAVRHVLQDMWQ